jgi:geranylgeranylglycerol-phosphate geranylgeranyltransferase
MGNNNHPKVKNSENIVVIEHVGYLIHYMKKRSQVYIFAMTSFISVLVADENVEPSIVLRLVAGTYMVSLATYIYNDLYDIYADRLNNVKRITVISDVNRKSLLRLVISLLASGLLLLISINIYTMMIACICSFLAVAYSHKRFNIKDRFPHKTIVNALGASLAALIGGFAVDDLDSKVLTLSALSFLYLCILAPLGDIQDYHGDRLAGKRTMPVVLGISRSIYVMMSMPLLILAVYLASNANIIGIAIVSSTCILTLLLLYILRREYLNTKYVKKSRHVLRITYIVMQISLLF